MLKLFLAIIFIFFGKSLTESLPFGCLTAFKLAALKAHNAYREIHSAPNLKLDESNFSAQKYAQLLAETNVLKHRIDTGENLFAKFTTVSFNVEMCASNYSIVIIFWQ